MTNSTRIPLAFLAIGLSLATASAQGIETTEDMRTMARMFAALEARDQKGYCKAMYGPAYTEYLTRVCQAAVQHKLKKPENCATESVAQELKADHEQCLAMSPAELDKAALRWQEGRKAFLEKMTAQGIDGEKLLQEERLKQH